MKLLGIGNGSQMIGGLAIGAAAVLLAPILLPVVSGVLKSLTKAGIKGGLILYEKGRVALEEAKESVEDLTAEAKAELAQPEQMAPKKKAVAAK
jgi:Protein of unknown function (DUF5132)